MNEPSPPPLDAPALLAALRAIPHERRVAAGLGLALAAAATGRHAEQALIVAAALDAGIDASAVVEGALMTHLFAGFPRAIEAFCVLEAVFARRGTPWPRAADGAAAAQHAQGGAAAFERIYGAQAQRVRAKLAAYAPAFEHAVIEDAYGRILARPQLPPKDRELMSVCALTALDLPRQLLSHLKGALACGATVEDLSEMVRLAADFVAAWPSKRPDLDGARALLMQVAASVRGPGASGAGVP